MSISPTSATETPTSGHRGSDSGTDTTLPPPEGTAGPPPSTYDRTRWAALVVLLVATFMDSVDVTVVNIAVPMLQRDLGASVSAVQWITGGYALTFALGLITGGRLGDLYGRKRVFMLGVAVFTLTSLLCGVAPNPGVLVVGRLLQGAAAALMVPQVLSIVHVTFPEKERPKVFGIFGAVLALGTVAGPLIGALLLEADLFGWSWRPIFLINLPLGVAGLIAGAILIHESKSAHAARLDVVGVVLAAASLLLLIYPLTRGRELDWPAWTFISMVASVPVLAAFVGYERRLAAKGGSPVVPPSLFRARTFSGGLAVQAFFGLTSGLFFLSWMIFLQLGLGWSPLKAGLAGLPLSAAMMIGAGLAAQALVPKFGRVVLQVGALLSIGGLALYVAVIAHNGASTTVWQNSIPLVLLGLGMGIIVAPLTDLTLSTVPHEHAGSASGLLNTVIQLGQALGIALSSVAFFSRLDAGQSMDHAFRHSLWFAIGAYAAVLALLFVLPYRTGIRETDR